MTTTGTSTVATPFGKWLADKHHDIGARPNEQYLFSFPNGFGASVIRGPYSYGGHEGLWELAVLNSNGGLTYETPITSDVLGRLSEADVAETLTAIAALPKAAA